MFREVHPRISRPKIRYEPQSGLNSANSAYPESQWIQCSRCGYTLNRQRCTRSTGDGITQPSTQLNGAVTAGATTITVDSTTGFAAVKTGSITAFSNVGRKTNVTSASHGLKGGKVVISSTTNYNGTFYIDNVLTNTFEIVAPFVADDATGTWTIPNSIYICDAGSNSTAGDVSTTYTKDTGSPRVNEVTYTGTSSTTFTGCSGALAHDDDMYVFGEITASGCPMCGTFMYD